MHAVWLRHGQARDQAQLWSLSPEDQTCFGYRAGHQENDMQEEGLIFGFVTRLERNKSLPGTGLFGAQAGAASNAASTRQQTDERSKASLSSQHPAIATTSRSTAVRGIEENREATRSLPQINRDVTNRRMPKAPLWVRTSHPGIRAKVSGLCSPALGCFHQHARW